MKPFYLKLKRGRNGSYLVVIAAQFDYGVEASDKTGNGWKNS